MRRYPALMARGRRLLGAQLWRLFAFVAPPLQLKSSLMRQRRSSFRPRELLFCQASADPALTTLWR